MRVAELDVDKYSYDKIRSLLIVYGAKELYFENVNILRLVVNTIKHSTGHSAKQLLATGSLYYNKLILLCNLQISGSSRGDPPDILNIGDVKYFGIVLTGFWSELSKTVVI